MLALKCIVAFVVACLYVGVLKVGRAFEIATLKIYMKQREEEYGEGIEKGGNWAQESYIFRSKITFKSI